MQLLLKSVLLWQGWLGWALPYHDHKSILEDDDLEFGNTDVDDDLDRHYRDSK